MQNRLSRSEETEFILREARRLFGELYGTFVLTFMHALGRMAGPASDHHISETGFFECNGFLKYYSIWNFCWVLFGGFNLF